MFILKDLKNTHLNLRRRQYQQSQIRSYIKVSKNPLHLSRQGDRCQVQSYDNPAKQI